MKMVLVDSNAEYCHLLSISTWASLEAHRYETV